MRLAVIASHPIQYHAPLFRTLAHRMEITVFFAHRASPADQAAAGFGVAFEWDIDLLSGYDHVFLHNVAKHPGLDRFGGCDTPGIREQLAAGRFDAVLTQGWHLKSYIQAGIAAKQLRLPLLVRGDSQLGTPRSTAKRLLKEATYPVLLRMFDAALYVGQRSRAYWTHYRYPERRLFFSPHCIDGEWFARGATKAAREELRSRLLIPAQTKLLLFAGKLVSFKRPLDVVRAAARLKSGPDPIAILVAGTGPLEKEFAQTARAADVTVHFLGFRNQSEMPATYAAADLLVLPSDGNETWGLVANEALACGKPIILADTVGSAPDLAGDGTAGRTYPLGDIPALAAAIQELLASPPSAARLAAKSAEYSLGAAAEGIHAAADWAISARSSRLNGKARADETRLRAS